MKAVIWDQSWGGGFMNWKVRPYHIHSRSNNLFSMRSIDIESRPKLESKLKISIGDPLTVCWKFKTTLKTPVLSLKIGLWEGSFQLRGHRSRVFRGVFSFRFFSWTSHGLYKAHIQQIIQTRMYMTWTYVWIKEPPPSGLISNNRLHIYILYITDMVFLSTLYLPTLGRKAPAAR